MKKLLKTIASFFTHNLNEIEPGETELDFIPPRELKLKKKNVIKKEKHIIHPLVKVQKIK